MIRSDIDLIASLIKQNARVLDVGCGEGEMLSILRQRKNTAGRGIEIDPARVSLCVKQGLSVMQGDADIDLAHYPTNAFDYGILTQTLQVTKYPDKILQEILRIAKYAIVSIPNFGYWENRLQLLLNGRMPVTSKLSFQWYETPNIHFCTIRDFVILCQDLGLKVEKKFAITPSGKVLPFSAEGKLANLLGEFGVFLITK